MISKVQNSKTDYFSWWETETVFSLRQQLKFFDLATLNAVFALPPSSSHRSIIFLVRHLFLIHVFRSTPPTIIVVSPSLIICEQVFSSLLKLRRAELQFSGFSPLDNTDQPVYIVVRLGVNNMVTTCFKNLYSSS